LPLPSRRPGHACHLSASIATAPIPWRPVIATGSIIGPSIISPAIGPPGHATGYAPGMPIISFRRIDFEIRACRSGLWYLGAMWLSETWKSHLLTKLNKDVPEAIFMQRLYDYDDLIAAMIHGLRSTA
jgi:hypothetical protein